MAKKNEKKGELTNEHDKFVKVALGITETMADYLNNFMPPELLDDLDISTLERVEESSITDELSEFFADLIWKLKFKNGTEFEIGILIEHKSWRPLYPHFQPLEYMIGRWRNKRKAEGKPELLVPIIIYHGTETWEIQKMETYFGDVPGSFLRFLPSFDILFTHITNLPDAIILACASSFLRRTFLTLKHSHDKEYLREHFAELLFLDFNASKDENSIFFFKAHYVYLSVSSKISKTDIKKKIKEIDMGHKSKLRELYAHEIIELEAKEEGRQEERKKNAIRLWQNGIDIPLISNITDMSVEQIEQLIADFKKQG
jgi:predicted transposase/invertase (TIGR01784 family)